MDKATTKIGRREGMKIAVRRLIREERGQALVLVLILLVVGGLIIAPLLEFMGMGLKVGKDVYENKMYQTYAADAGVEDGLWKIKHGGLAGSGNYSEYDYSSQWPYSLNESVNGYGVNVTIENVWMPKDIPAPDPATAQDIITEGKLIITGGPSLAEESTYEIKISYARDCPADPLPNVNTIGIWLPPGFGYTEYSGSCSLQSESFYSAPTVSPYKGSYAVVWNFAAVPLSSFPGGNPEAATVVITFTFQYTGPEGQSPNNAVSWINTSGVPGITYTWDADVKIYQILSVAGDCEVEAYAAKIEVRKLGAAISGDYHAIGNTLMTATTDEKYRNRLYKESSATVEEGDIPSDATIEKAWLYWSGWIEGGDTQTPFEDGCDDMNDWIPGSDWQLYIGWGGDREFRGHHSGGGIGNRYLTMGDSVPLGDYSGQEVTVSWAQRTEGWGLDEGDCLYFAFSDDGGSNWLEPPITAFCGGLGWGGTYVAEIPQEYLTDSFKMRFRLEGFSDWGQYVYIDDITISVSVSAAPSVEDAKVNRVMFNGNPITASQWQTAPTPEAGQTFGATGGENSWCYSCFYDVTDLELSGEMTVRDYIEEEMKSGGGGMATFTLGHVLEGSGYTLHPSGTTGYPLATPAQLSGYGYGGQYQWTYAGWSLIIIYSSPETKGHQLYLFDDLHYVAVATTLDFPISGFLVPDPVGDEEYSAHITCFVGDGDEHYSGDFIALNAPDVPNDQIPNEYKLWDGITVSAIRTLWSGQYFSNTADSPNNVWNSQSPGLEANGVDIDNFDVTWSSGLLQPGDTSAEVSLGNASSNPNDAELIMLVYIIISFRSSTTSGGSISYLIRG